MRARLLRSAAIALVVAVVASTRTAPAHADETSVAAATVLFDEGVKLLDAGKAAEACLKLARSQALAPSGGTLLALGECYEKTGRTASAWVAFREAAARAASAGKAEAEASALERAKRLEPMFARLVITVPPASQTAGLEIKRDGTVLKDAELGVAVPADPGSHQIQASAPHMKLFAKTITARAGETIDFPIPKLAPETAESGSETPAPPGDTTSPPPIATSSVGTTQRVVGIAVAGVGVVSVIGGSVFGLMAKSKNNQALEPQNCPTRTTCNPTGITLTSTARSEALVSTILFIVGGTGLAVGGIVFFTAPSASGASGAMRGSASPHIHVVPSVDLASAGGTATLVW